MQVKKQQQIYGQWIGDLLFNIYELIMQRISCIIS